MKREIKFTGDFPSEPRQSLRPGGWYIGFLCRHCRKHFAIMEDPTDTGEVELSGDAAFKVVCPGCAKSNEYSAADLILFEAAQGGPTSTA